MLKKVILALAIAVAVPFVASAQKFGVVDANAIIQAMPDFKEMQGKLTESSKRYEEEYGKLQQEVQKKVEEYQALAADTPDAIKARRQQELEELGAKAQRFHQTASQDLDRQQQQLMAPIEEKLINAIKGVGAEGGYTMIFPEGAAAYTGADVKDVTADVKARLGIK